MRIQLVQLQFNSTLARDLAYHWLKTNGLKATQVNETWVDVEDITLDQLTRLNVFIDNLNN